MGKVVIEGEISSELRRQSAEAAGISIKTTPAEGDGTVVEVGNMSDGEVERMVKGLGLKVRKIVGAADGDAKDEETWGDYDFDDPQPDFSEE